MKKICILLLLFGILGACKKDEPFIAPIDQLPPATQEGANTSGCLVDGEAFIELRNRSCQYVNQRNFSFGISNEINGKHYHVLISMKNTELEVGKTYQLTEEFGENTKSGTYIINTLSPPSPYYYETKTPIIGEVTITVHNFDKAFLSGTFWFDSINSEGKIVEIREGRFDMDY